MRLRFHTLDVFTDRPLAGNPLAVVHDADGLGAARMQAVAREFNLSETVFLLRPDDPASTARIRVFTPHRELPFAGHPTVGTGVLLAVLRAGDALGGGGLVVALEAPIGLLRVEVTRRAGAAARGAFALPVLPFEEPWETGMGAVAAALGLEAADLGQPGHRPSRWSAGKPYAMVPLASADALARARIGDPEAWDRAFGPGGAAYLYARAGADDPEGADVLARMFTGERYEDPATGSAVAAFAGLAAAFERPGPGAHRLRIAQGREMGRPSLIDLDLDVEGGAEAEEDRLVGARVGGAAVVVQEGWLTA